jgi:hypothetical protein
LFAVAVLAGVVACSGDSGGGDAGRDVQEDAGTDVAADLPAADLDEPDASADLPSADLPEEDVPTDLPDADAADVPDTGPEIPEYARVPGLEPPPKPPDSLGFDPPTRKIDAEIPTDEEVTAFTRKVMAFFAQSDYFNYIYRMTHGLDASYDPEMMPYRLWWTDCGIQRDGDTITFKHGLYSENITKRTIKVMINAAAAYLLIGDERMAELAADLMRGIVALSIGFENQREDPLVKYLQARAIMTHDHAYEVDGRKVVVDYSGSRNVGAKWNVHSFEIPDNPMYGAIWATNMRSKDDVPYMHYALNMATRLYHETDNQELKDAAALFIEYMRGFAQRIVEDEWFILTRYADGIATPAVDTTKTGSPLADLGNYTTWEGILGPDAECNAQLSAALAAYGSQEGKGSCAGGMAGWQFDLFAGQGNWFNYHIYNYFHVAALATANLWGRTEVARALIDGLVTRFERLLNDHTLPNRDHKEFDCDFAGVMLVAATQGYPLSANEARHIMQWYGDTADWYGQWPHYDPWATLPDGQFYGNWKPPRDGTRPDGEGGEEVFAHVRLQEMPYIFEYCYSPLKAPNGVKFIDCDIVRDPTRWAEGIE